MIIVVAWAALTALAPAPPGFMVVSVGSLLTTVALYEIAVKRTNVTRFSSA